MEASEGGTATAVLASGAKGRRYSMENTRILLQQPMGGLQGSAGACVGVGSGVVCWLGRASHWPSLGVCHFGSLPLLAALLRPPHTHTPPSSRALMQTSATSPPRSSTATCA